MIRTFPVDGKDVDLNALHRHVAAELARWVERKQARAWLLSVENESTPIGVVGTRHYTIESKDGDEEDLAAVYVALVALAPDYRGARIRVEGNPRLSDTLLRVALDAAIADGRAIAVASVHRANAPSIKMLTRNGFDEGPGGDQTCASYFRTLK